MSAAPTPASPTRTSSRPDIRAEIGETLKLAGPAIIARAGMLFMSIADTVMVGQYDTAELAYLGLAWSLSTVLLVANIGLLMGTLVKTSQAFGRKDYIECGRVWRRAMPLAVIIGSIGAFLCLEAEWLLLAVGQTPDVAAGAAPVTIAYGVGLIPIAIAVGSQFFLEGIKRPIPAMLAMMVANILNIGLNSVMIYGAGSISAMGAEGAAWATTGARTMLAAVAVGYILLMRDRGTFGMGRGFPKQWSGFGDQMKIGLATGAALIAESSAFSALTMMAGLAGVLALGAFTATMNLLAVVFMAALGIGAATSVRVGAAWGPGDKAGAERAGWIGLGVNTVAMALIAIALAPTARWIASLYGLEDAAQEMAADAMQLAGIVILVDGAQAVLANALRARGDVWPTTAIQIACFVFIMLPAAYVFTLVWTWGPVGLMSAIGLATLASTISLAARFRLLALADRRETP